MANVVIMPLNFPRQHLNTMEDYLGGKRKHFKMGKMVQESPFRCPSAKPRLYRGRSFQDITEEI